MAEDPKTVADEFAKRVKAGEIEFLSPDELDRSLSELTKGRQETRKVIEALRKNK